MRADEARQMLAIQTHIIRPLFEMLQPVALANCQLERFGEAHDGGYLMCANLLNQVQSGYWYGISGYDKWGCDISTKLKVRLHQYDCFDTTQPACPGGDTVFHAECVDGRTRTEEGRFFDTIENQFAKNGDAAKRIAMKIDVEGAEWDSFLSAPRSARPDRSTGGGVSRRARRKVPGRRDGSSRSSFTSRTSTSTTPPAPTGSIPFPPGRMRCCLSASDSGSLTRLAWRVAFIHSMR